MFFDAIMENYRFPLPVKEGEMVSQRVYQIAAGSGRNSKRFLIGLAAGLLGGLVGVGGGVVMIPLMVRFFKFSQHQGHGTSLMALVFTGLAGAFTYGRKGSVDVLAALLLAAAAMVTARFGALYAQALPERGLKRAFGLYLIFISLLLLSKSYLPHLSILGQGAGSWGKPLVLLGVGAVTGFISGMMGTGGAGIMVVAMVLLAGFSQHTAQGSALLAMVPAGAMGAYTHWRLGNVVFQVLSGLIVGIILGTYGGSSAAMHLSELHLRLLFSGMLIMLGIRYVRSAAQKRLALVEAAKAA